MRAQVGTQGGLPWGARISLQERLQIFQADRAFAGGLAPARSTRFAPRQPASLQSASATAIAHWLRRQADSTGRIQWASRNPRWPN